MTGTCEVLVADDSRTIRNVLSTIIGRWGFVASEATNGEEAWRRLQEPGAPRLALLDWEMPRMNGPEVCRLLRGREGEGASYTYVLLVTSRSAKYDMVAGIEAGADDYVVKPFDEHELRARLRTGRRIVELQRELYRLKEMFREQSRTDPLTGCLNRRAIMERLAGELSRASREGSSLSVGVVDIDRFKQLNDTLGHPAGDAALCELARRMQSALRGSDAFGRTGGEEFVVLWPGAEVSGARFAGERLRHAIADGPFVVAGTRLPVTVSVGVTSTAGDEAPEIVLARADQALYAAKRNGRDRVEVAAPLAHVLPRAV